MTSGDQSTIPAEHQPRGHVVLEIEVVEEAIRLLDLESRDACVAALSSGQPVAEAQVVFSNDVYGMTVYTATTAYDTFEIDTCWVAMPSTEKAPAPGDADVSSSPVLE